MKDEDWIEPEWSFESYMQSHVDGAMRKDFNASRYLFKELARALRTGTPGALSHPPVREFLASAIDGALEAPSAGVSDALRITRPPYAKRTRSPLSDTKSKFIIWFCTQYDVLDREPAPKEARAWIAHNCNLEVGSGTISEWKAEARLVFSNPKSAYQMFKDVMPSKSSG